MSDSPNPETPRTRRSLFRWLLRIGGLVVLVVAVYGMARIIREAAATLRESDFQWRELNWTALAAATVLWTAGTLAAGSYWYFALLAMGQRPRWLSAVRAYVVGGLGKYVPGKALAVVMRAALVRSPQVDQVVAAAAVFVETLSLMSAGSVLAAALLAARTLAAEHPTTRDWLLLATAVGLAAVCGVPMVPPLFRRLVRVLQLHRLSGGIESAARGMSVRLLVAGGPLLALAWLFQGLALWAVLQGIPARFWAGGNVEQDFLLAIAANALSAAAGFVSPLPAGLGVRDFVVAELMTGPFGPGVAVLAACLVRVATLVSDLVASAILYLVPVGEVAPAAPATAQTSKIQTPSPPRAA